MQALQQLNSRLVDVAMIAVASVIIWKALSTKIDNVTTQATKPAGDALSDLFARLNGWEPVTLVPLMIRDFYLTDDYRLTADADATLWKIEAYQPFLTELFGVRGGQLKEQYRSLINVEITKRSLSNV